jgi:hypothetical protein
MKLLLHETMKKKKIDIRGVLGGAAVESKVEGNAAGR